MIDWLGWEAVMLQNHSGEQAVAAAAAAAPVAAERVFW
jgi:hypothetical protein